MIYRSLLGDSDVIIRDMDDSILASDIINWCKNDMKLNEHWFSYNEHSKTIIFSEGACKQLSTYPYRIFKAFCIDGRYGNPEIKFFSGSIDSICPKPQTDLMIKYGLTPSDIHIKPFGTLNRLAYIGDLSQPLICEDASGLVGIDDFSIYEGWDEKTLTTKNLNNINYLIPDVNIYRLNLSGFQMFNDYENLNVKLIAAYNINGGLYYKQYKLFTVNKQSNIIINPDINQNELLDDIIDFSNRNPKLEIIKTIVAGRYVEIFIKDIVKTNQIEYEIRV